MVNASCCDCARTEGSLALASSGSPRLVLIQGGAGRTDRAGRPLPTGPLPLRESLALVLCGLLVILSLAAVSSLVSAQAARASAAAISERDELVVMVGEGDTVWEIAEDHPVEGVTTQELVTWISARNGLSGEPLGLGQRLVVPGAPA